MSQLDKVVLGSTSIFCFVTGTITPAATAASLSAEQAFTVTGQPSPLLASDVVTVSSSVASGNAVTIGSNRVNSSGQLCITYVNPTAGSLTHAAGTYTVLVARA